jgi:inosine-uridine nucleoside N-ribohydrolase
VKIILDTDIGTDIDDAVCLAYLLAQPACELLGVTTVTGQPRRRAEMASALCHAAGRPEVPIHVGAAAPLLVDQLQDRAEQAEALGEKPRAADLPATPAVQWLRQTIREHPGEVTLLAIGPLTNVGLLFALDPEIPALLRGLLLMCGRFRLPIPDLELREWNARGDPHAMAVVYRAPAAPHRSVGTCVTRQVTMPAGTVRERFAAPRLRPLLDFAEVWFRRADRITFHDPLAAAALFDPALLDWERGRVTVELTSPALQGLTHWQPDPAGGPHEIAVTVEAERFFDHFFQTLGA